MLPRALYSINQLFKCEDKIEIFRHIRPQYIYLPYTICLRPTGKGDALKKRVSPKKKIVQGPEIGGPIEMSGKNYLLAYGKWKSMGGDSV